MDSAGWVFRVRAYDGESFGHFLGRFRRANTLSHKALADYLGVRLEWVRDWESPSRRRNPTELQLLALAKLVEVDCEQLVKMLPPSHLHLQTRLCSACYEEVPMHRAQWQQADYQSCDRHQLELLSACPVCRSGFQTPALWEGGCCENCQFPFSPMHAYKKGNKV
jgi:transcriptional regulator with XRE-family HTH domain